jgi:hypothetical protein
MWQNHLATRLSNSATWRSDLADFLILEKMRYGGYSYVHISAPLTSQNHSYLLARLGVENCAGFPMSQVMRHDQVLFEPQRSSLVRFGRG